jgi:putative component of membrane protein insertase Oxa1/YidC/SpoIIIJ protein YidD
MRSLLLAAIRAYQRYLSPHKGFACAYRVHTGRSNCSALGYRAVRRHGVFAGLGLIRRRTLLCGVAHRRHAPPLAALQPQRGVCDLGCDLPGHCDWPGGHGLGTLGDGLSWCDCCSCDWPSRRRTGREQERTVYLPPQSQRMRQPQRQPKRKR